MTNHAMTLPALPKSKSSVSGLAALGLAETLPVLVWAVIPPQSTGDDYAVGPFHLDVVVERVVGVVTLIVLLASAAAVIRGRRTPQAISVGALSSSRAS